MAYDSTPDIYLMKRQKTRAGCLTALVVTAAVALVLGIAYAVHHHYATRGNAPATDTLALPDGAVEAPIEAAQLPGTAAADQPVAPTPAEEASASPDGNPGTPVPEAPSPSAVPSAPEAQPPAAPVAATSQPLPATPEAAAEALATAKRQRDEGDLAAARASALQALAAAPGDPATEQFLGEIDIPLLASRRPMPEKVEYSIHSGDYLGKIAAKFNTPVALISVANGIDDPTRIRIGQQLVLLDGNAHRFAVTVSKSRNDLVLTLDGAFFKRYRVATGKGGKTPVGTYKVVDKIEHPTWHVAGRAPIPYGDPDNLLGTHWLALDLEGYGLHGTWDPASLGSQASDGCVRLHNDDIKELYTILPKGTVVTIAD